MILIKPQNLFAKNSAFIRVPKHFLGASFSADAKQSSTLKSPLANLLNNTDTNTPAANEQSPVNDAPPEEDDKKKREESWRKMKITLSIFGVSFTCLGIYLIVELGTPRKDEHGVVIKDRFTSMPLVKQYIYRTIGELNYYGQLLKEPSRDKLLPDPVRTPFYQPKFTLVMEFTDVLVHPEWEYQTGWRFKKRPAIDYFLESIASNYELVIYTAEQGMTVFPIVEALDPKNYIHYKLVRDATLFTNGQHLKDLDKLNRDLSQVIVLDWNKDCTKDHRDNVLAIPRWDGSNDDVALIHLTAFLLAIVESGIDDVREVMRYYHQFDDPIKAYRERQRKLMEEAEAQEQLINPGFRRGSIASRWLPSFIRRD